LIDKRDICSRWKGRQTLHEIGRAYGHVGKIKGPILTEQGRRIRRESSWLLYPLRLCFLAPPSEKRHGN